MKKILANLNILKQISKEFEKLNYFKKDLSFNFYFLFRFVCTFKYKEI